jgi:hypothetical protein
MNRFCRGDVTVFYYRIKTGSRWKKAAFGVSVILLSLAVITVSASSVCYRLLFIRTLIYRQLNILEWTIRRMDMHVFATANASTRILLTVLVLIRFLFTPELWKMQITLKKKVSLISILICTTGVGTLPLILVQLKHYHIHKEEGLSAEILWYRILEAGLNVVFICFPQALKAVLGWLGKRDGATRASLRTKTTFSHTSRYVESGQKLEIKMEASRRFSKVNVVMEDTM